jgi:CubicO group peptidase (beta-lactamase class C family)
MKLKNLRLWLFLALFLALASCATRSYLARVALWNASDITDYQKFPERKIANSPPPFFFQQQLRPELFPRVEYRVRGRKRQAELEPFLRATQTTAFIIIQHDIILYENYFNGYTRDSVNTSFSVAKSFDSALIGVALDEGRIRSVQDPITDYLPELKGRGLDQVTIRDLLTMSTGIRYTAGPLPWRDEPKTYYDPNLRALALSVQPEFRVREKSFWYNNYYPLLEGMILERVTQKPVSQYFQEKIWEPLGMEFPASWSLDSEEDGFEKMESGINARAIDFAKFGRLFLYQGRWDGRQIIPEAWVWESTSPDPADNRLWRVFREFQEENNGYYKYHWWGKKRENGQYDFMAIGHLGQFIYICPEKDLIIVRFGKKYGRVDSWPAVFRFLADKLPPS